MISGRVSGRYAVRSLTLASFSRDRIKDQNASISGAFGCDHKVVSSLRDGPSQDKNTSVTDQPEEGSPRPDPEEEDAERQRSDQQRVGDHE